MTKKHIEVWRAASAVWLAAVCAAIICFSLYGEYLPPLYRGKAFGIFSCLAMAVCSVFEGMAREKGSVPMALFFLAGAVLEALYAYYGIRSGQVRIQTDAMVTSGIFCAAVLAGRAVLCGKRRA